MKRNWWRIYPYLPLLIGGGLLFVPSLATGNVVFWGTPSLQFIPWMVTAFKDIQQGIMPLWNPLNGMGAPLIANYQLAFFYPVNWLLYIFFLISGAPGVAWGYTLLLMVHFIWAGAGMIWLVRQLRVGILGQAIAGAAFGLCGYLVARVGFISMVWAGAWFPWIVASVTSLIHSERDQQHQTLFAWLRLVLCIFMQLLAGHAQLSWYSLLFTAGWVIFTSWQLKGFRFSIRLFLVFCSAGGLAASMAAIQLIPTAEYLLQTQRASSVDYESAMTYSFWSWRFLSFIVPDLFGNPGMGDYWGYASYWEDAVYLGILPFLLAVSTIIRAFRKKANHEDKHKVGLIRFLWIWIVIGSILALGSNTLVFPFLYRYIPTFDMFNAPARYMLWVVFPLSILAGIASEKWKTPTGKGLYWLRLATAGSFAVTLGAFLAWWFVKNIDVTFIRATALAGMWGLGTGLLTLFQPSIRIDINPTGSADKSTSFPVIHWGVYVWYILIAGLLVSDLTTANRYLIPTVDNDIYRSEIQIFGLSNHRLYIPAEDEYTLKFKQFFTFSDYSPNVEWIEIRQAMLPNINLLDGIPMVNIFDPLTPSRFAKWMDEINQLSEVERIPYLQMMDVGKVEIADYCLDTGYSYINVENPGRLRWYTCGKSVSNYDEAMKMMFQEKIPPEYIVLENADGLSDIEGCQNSGYSTEYAIISQTPNRIQIKVMTSTTGWLMLADTWYPGWIVKIDGIVSDIYPANGVFKATQVNSGTHLIEVIYRPVSFYLGAGVSMVSVLALITVICLGLRRK